MISNIFSVFLQFFLFTLKDWTTFYVASNNLRFYSIFIFKKQILSFKVYSDVPNKLGVGVGIYDRFLHRPPYYFLGGGGYIKFFFKNITPHTVVPAPHTIFSSWQTLKSVKDVGRCELKLSTSFNLRMMRFKNDGNWTDSV